MTVVLTEEPMASLSEYARVPIIFTVDRIYPLLGATIRDLGSPRGLRRQYDALVDALRRDGPFAVVHGYQALPSGLTRDNGVVATITSPRFASHLATAQE